MNSTPEGTINAATKNEIQWLINKIQHAESIALTRPSPRTIYKVPDFLRNVNHGAYSPQLISIGPFHYSSQKLQSMENHKLRYLKCFMERTNISKEMLASIIQEGEESVRGCYAEAIPFDPYTLMQIILLDASFIIEFFLRDWSQDWTEDDRIELKPWEVNRIELDLILLENQLPFFIISKLYELLPLGPSSKYPSSFLELTFNFFGHKNVQNIRHDDIESEEVKHFVDLLRYFYLPPYQRHTEKSNFKVVTEMYCASQLAEAGLKFKPISRGSSILGLKFNEGVLEIPTFTLDHGMEIYARNLVAFEQCHYPLESYVTGYYIMLDFLVKTGKDVDILVQQGIIVNEGGINSIPPLLSTLCTGISSREVSDDYYDLCGKLVDFREKHWYVSLMRRLGHDFFRTPWVGAASAIILFILTLLQTVFTFISTFK